MIVVFSEQKILDEKKSQDYASILEMKTLPAIKGILLQFSKNNLNKNDCLHLAKNVLLEFVSIRTEATLLGALQSAQVADSTIKILRDYILTDCSVDSRNIVLVIQAACRILDGISQYLKDFQTESVLAEDLNMKDLLNRFSVRVNKMQVILGLIVELQDFNEKNS